LLLPTPIASSCGVGRLCLRRSMIRVRCHVRLGRLRVLSWIDLGTLVVLRFQRKGSLHLVIGMVALLATIEPPASHLLSFDLNTVSPRSSCWRSCSFYLNAIRTRGCCGELPSVLGLWVITWSILVSGRRSPCSLSFWRMSPRWSGASRGSWRLLARAVGWLVPIDIGGSSVNMW